MTDFQNFAEAHETDFICKYWLIPDLPKLSKSGPICRCTLHFKVPNIFMDIIYVDINTITFYLSIYLQIQTLF